MLMFSSLVAADAAQDVPASPAPRPHPDAPRLLGLKKEISVLLQPLCKVVAMSKSAQGRNLTWYCFDQHIPSVALAEPGQEVPAPPCLMPVLPRLRVPAGTRVGWDMEAAAWVRWALQADDSWLPLLVPGEH